MKRVNVYAAIRESRERIVKAMQERDIKELAMCMSYKEWGKKRGYTPDDYEEEEDDDMDYQDYLTDNAPYVIFFDKYNNGIDYRVDKVTLKRSETGDSVLKFDCYADELGEDTFGEDDLVFLTLYNVYSWMEKLLCIKDEPNCVWVFTAEQAWDGETADVVVRTFATEEAAQKHLQDWLNDGGEDESINEYEENKGWEVECNEPNLYRAFEDGYYADNHIELTITKCEIQK